MLDVVSTDAAQHGDEEEENRAEGFHACGCCVGLMPAGGGRLGECNTGFSSTLSVPPPPKSLPLLAYSLEGGSVAWSCVIAYPHASHLVPSVHGSTHTRFSSSCLLPNNVFHSFSLSRILFHSFSGSLSFLLQFAQQSKPRFVATSSLTWRDTTIPLAGGHLPPALQSSRLCGTPERDLTSASGVALSLTVALTMAKE